LRRHRGQKWTFRFSARETSIAPEFQDKKGWSRLWKEQAGPLLPKGEFGYFRNEHDEEPAGKLATLSKAKITELAEELQRKRGGQIVLGKMVPRRIALSWRPDDYQREALETFDSFSALYRLH
jgi:hypothetical protein